MILLSACGVEGSDAPVGPECPAEHAAGTGCAPGPSLRSLLARLPAPGGGEAFSLAHGAGAEGNRGGVVGNWVPARGGDRWLAPDKAKHMVISAVLVWGVYRVYHGGLGNDPDDARWVAGGAVGLLGVGKEVRDTRLSPRDLVADAVGIALGLVFLTD